MTPGAPGALDLDKLYAARLQAARARPCLATALFALHVVESRQVPTMAVDRHWRCYASPGFVDRTAVEELAGVWVHEVSHLLRDHHGRSDRFVREHGPAGPAERLRMNIAADCEINDDVFGDGLVRPTGAVEPRHLELPEGELMEDYLRQFRLGPRTQHLAWLDCGSGADGLEREWDQGPAGAHGLSAQERDAVRFRVAQGIIGRPGNASKGWQRWAQEVFHPPQPWRQLLGAALRSAVSGAGAGDDYTYGRPARRSAGVPGVVLPSLRRGPLASRWSSTRRVRSATPNSAVRCWRSPPSPVRWAAGGIWSPSWRATRRPGSSIRCAVPRASHWSGVAARICARGSPRRSGRSPGPMSSWPSPTGRPPGPPRRRRAGRWWVCSTVPMRGGGTRPPSTFPTNRPLGPARWSSAPLRRERHPPRAGPRPSRVSSGPRARLT